MSVPLRRMNVDVQLISHPLFDGLFDKLELLKTRKPGDRHPVVVGTDAYQRCVGIMRECTWLTWHAASKEWQVTRQEFALNSCEQVMMSRQFFVFTDRAGQARW